MADYKRFPIILNNHTVAVIRLFTRYDRLEDLWLTEGVYSDPINTQKEAAQQLIAQLEDHWTPLFLMELRDAITEKLQEHDKDYGTKFA